MHRMRCVDWRQLDQWSRLVVPRDRFLSVRTEALFGPLRVASLPQMAPWLAYVAARYPWVFEGADPIGKR